MLHDARPEDAGEIGNFLAKHSATSMFLRSNLAEFGTEPCDDPRSTRFVFSREKGEINAVAGLSQAGFLVLQAPENPAFLAALKPAFKGRKLSGINGASQQVEEALHAFGLNDAEFALRAPEPLYELPLSALKIPDAPGNIRRATEADRALLQAWILDYDTGTLGLPVNADIRAQCARKVEASIDSDRHVVLEVEGRAVAKTAFNAVLPDAVQIGGVYTPPALRSKGYARLAVALHLAQARTQGVEKAFLFSSSPDACRAYEAIGFRRIGSYSLAILKTAIEV
ncbi:MAG: GNAT family N-acetyltransferase [Rhodobacterales bacterium]|nr:MAG: GNAT family N-acetyltransferase [Rhodobacterales bacterium]